MAGLDDLVNLDQGSQAWPGLWPACLGNLSLHQRGLREKQGALGAVGSSIQERSLGMGLDWALTGRQGGGNKSRSLVGSRGTPHPVAVGFPAIPTSIPRPIPTGRGMPWPFPRLANLASNVLSSGGLHAWRRGGGEGPAANPGCFQNLAVFRVMVNIATLQYCTEHSRDVVGHE